MLESNISILTPASVHPFTLGIKLAKVYRNQHQEVTTSGLNLVQNFTSALMLHISIYLTFRIF